MGGDGGDGGSGDGSGGDGSGDGNDGNASDGSFGGGDSGNEGNQSGNDPGISGDGSVSDNDGNTSSDSVSVSDFGGFGDNASLANDAAAATAQTGYGIGDFGSLGNYGFGPTDAPTGANPANTPGFGAYADASLGPGIGYGDIGGFGYGGVGNGISGFGGFGGYGSNGPGSPGGFGGIGVASFNDSVTGTANAMGLTGFTGMASSLPGEVGAALATLGENIGTPAAPALAALSDAQNSNVDGKSNNLNADFGPTSINTVSVTPTDPVTTQVTQQEATPVSDPETDPTQENLAAINAKAVDLSFMNEDGSPGKGVTTTSVPANAALAGLTNSLGFNGFSQSPTGVVGVAPSIAASFTGFSPTDAPSIGLSPQESINAANVALAAQNNQPTMAVSNWGDVNSVDAMADPTTGVATVPGNFSIGLGSPSLGVNVGVGSSSPGTATASNAPAQGISGAFNTPSNPSVTAALANAMNSEIGFDTGNGIESILLAQYPWLQFQPTS